MGNFVSTALYLGTVGLLATGIVLLLIDRRQRIMAERKLLAERRQAMIEQGIQAILEREAHSIAAASQRRQEVAGDARWHLVCTWLSDMLRMNDIARGTYWSSPRH